MNARQIGGIDERAGNLFGVARDEVDDAWRETGGFEDLERVVPLSIALDAGFQTTVLPMIAGAVVKLPPIAVKLNGVMA